MVGVIKVVLRVLVPSELWINISCACHLSYFFSSKYGSIRHRAGSRKILATGPKGEASNKGPSGRGGGEKEKLILIPSLF